MIRHTLELILNPFFISMILLLMCTYFVWRRTHQTFVKIGLLVVCAILLLISTPWLPDYVSDFLEDEYPIVTKIDSNIRWVVVLGGGTGSDALKPVNMRLSSASVLRVVEGVRLFKALPNAKLLLSGGGETPLQIEAKGMEELSRWFEIPADKTVLETRSLNTAEQAREILAIVHDNPFYLVTSAMHMPRAMALFKQLGMHPIPAPTDYLLTSIDLNYPSALIPNGKNVGLFYLEMHEVLGRIWVNLTKLK